MPVRHGSSARFETEKFPANAAAALHRSATRSRDEVLPLDHPIHSPTRLLTHLVLDCDNNRNILLFWNLYTSHAFLASSFVMFCPTSEQELVVKRPRRVSER